MKRRKENLYIATPKTWEEYERVCAELGLSIKNPAPNSCIHCRHAKTCGYSAYRISEAGRGSFLYMAHVLLG